MLVLLWECSRKLASCIELQWPKYQCIDLQMEYAHRTHYLQHHGTMRPFRDNLEKTNLQYLTFQLQRALVWHPLIFHLLRRKHREKKIEQWENCVRSPFADRVLNPINSPNALHIDIFSSNAISGITIIVYPICDTISLNDSPRCKISCVVSLTTLGIENGGIWIVGIPDGMVPITCKSTWNEWCSTYEIKPVKMTTMALRAVPINHTNLFNALCQVDFVWWISLEPVPVLVASKRINSNIIKHDTPIIVSIHRVLLIFWKIDDHVCINVVPFASIARIFLTCDVKIMSAHALVKPEFTGPDTKLMKNPIPIKPMITSTMPVRKHNRTAFCQTPPVAWNVSNDAIDDGPIGTSLHEPSNMYTKLPINEPYKPYCMEGKMNKKDPSAKVST